MSWVYLKVHSGLTETMSVLFVTASWDLIVVFVSIYTVNESQIIAAVYTFFIGAVV